jgi:hypothetical protein
MRAIKLKKLRKIVKAHFPDTPMLRPNYDTNNYEYAGSTLRTNNPARMAYKRLKKAYKGKL